MADATSYRGVAPATTAWAVLVAISLCHMINDIMQSMLAAIYPLLRQEFALSYWQIGLMTFAFQVCLAAAAGGWRGDGQEPDAALAGGGHGRDRGGRADAGAGA